MRKLLIIFVFGIMILGFVNGASYPAPFVIGENSESQEEIDCKTKGCFEDDICYPFGYRKDSRFCSTNMSKYWNKYKIEVSGWDNQSSVGESCQNNFECLSELCFEGKCVNQSQELTLMKEQLKEMQEKINSYEINSLEEKQNENLMTGNVVADTTNGKSFFRKVWVWFFN